nr:cob(I)yrinic acid a,c-diamide adenosyltransferase [uncultured Romboutsia sp.]
MRIYTKTGDKGQTSLYDGTRVDKDSIRVESYGTIDELNSYIGLCMHYINKDEKKVLFNIQRDLFYIGAELATKNTEKLNKVVSDDDIRNLESIIDKYMGEAKGLDSFIIPGTSLASAHLHIARTICRRAERIIISLGKIEQVNPLLIKYINRLSDVLYAIARYSEDKLIPMEF